MPATDAMSCHSPRRRRREGGREAALPRKIPFRRLAQLAFARSRPLFIVGSTQRGRFGLLRCPKKCANLCMPVECRRHAILLSRRDASDVVLSPQVVWDTVVRSFSFTHGDACSRSWVGISNMKAIHGWSHWRKSKAAASSRGPSPSLSPLIN